MTNYLSIIIKFTAATDYNKQWQVEGKRKEWHYNLSKEPDRKEDRKEKLCSFNGASEWNRHLYKTHLWKGSPKYVVSGSITANKHMHDQQHRTQ